MKVFILIFLCIGGQCWVELLLINFWESFVVVLAKYLEQGLLVILFEKGVFEFQQGILLGVYVNVVYCFGCIQQVIQCIVVCVGDYDNFVVCVNVYEFVVVVGVFLIGIVNEVVFVYVVEYLILQVVDFCYFFRVKIVCVNLEGVSFELFLC